MRQFFRLGECYRRVVADAGGSAHDFFVRVRPDLQWVGPFDASTLLASAARRRIGLRYRSCAGVEGVTLGQLQMAWYKVGPDACGEARWQTDYACVTLDDQFALVPARLADAYFDFAKARLSDAYTALRARSPAVPPCSCWRCLEGRLTEYVTLRALPYHVLSLPATYVYDDKNAPPMLLPETAADGGGADAAWSPSTRAPRPPPSKARRTERHTKWPSREPWEVAAACRML